jgi:hypothetical protein
MSEAITSTIHLSANSRAEVNAVRAHGRLPGFYSIEIRAHRDRYSNVTLLLPEATTREQADAIANAINAAVEINVMEEA